MSTRKVWIPRRFRTHPTKTLKPADRPLVPIARLDGLFGVRGELKCRPSSAGDTLIQAGRRFALDERGEREVVLASVRRHHGRFVVTFENVNDAAVAQTLVGKQLFVTRDAVGLQPGEYLDGDLAGLRLIDEQGAGLGTVSHVEHYPASDCLVVAPQNTLVPMVREFILAVDLAQRTILVRLPEGLLDGTLAEEA